MKNSDEKSKTIISFVAIRIIVSTIFLTISLLFVDNVYGIVAKTNVILAWIFSIIFVIFMMSVVNKVVTEFVLKIIKNTQ